MNVRFLCPNCEAPAKVPLPGPALWQCPHCEHRLTLDAPVSAALPECVICGNPELYKKKDFPHNLGLGILTVACAISFITYLNYQVWLTWSILIGTALFDGLLYWWVGDVVVCYRCHAQYRGLPREADHKPFDLGIGERYRQEQIRRELLRRERQTQEKG